MTNQRDVLESVRRYYCVRNIVVGKGIANPLAAVLSAGMLLAWLGRVEDEAGLLEHAARRHVVREGDGEHAREPVRVDGVPTGDQRLRGSRPPDLRREVEPGVGRAAVDLHHLHVGRVREVLQRRQRRRGLFPLLDKATKNAS